MPDATIPDRAPALQQQIEALRDGDDWAVEAADLLIAAARESDCSDLHIACLRDALMARGRRDGGFFPLARIPASRRDLLIARLKVMARVPAFIRHEPQDGRMAILPSCCGPLSCQRSTARRLSSVFPNQARACSTWPHSA